MLSISNSSELPGRCSAAEGAPRWRLQVFGGLRVRSGRTGEPLALQGRQRELLTLLALDRLRPRAVATRYCDVLWPDSDGAAARSNLDSTVHRLRRALGSPQSLHVSEGFVWLDCEMCATDVDELAGIACQLDAHAAIGASELCQLAVQLLDLTAAGGLLPVPREAARPAAYLWRSVTRELALRLDAAGHTAQAMRLCERYLTSAESDAGLLRLWVDMLERSGRSIAATHVREEFTRSLLLM